MAGLSIEEVVARRARYGPNALPEAKRRSLAALFLGQFASPLIYLLFAAAAIAFALGKWGDSLVILLVVIANAVIGAIQEGRAERSLSALRRLAGLKATVRRAGRDEIVEARDVVPGDLLVLAAGDAVAADAKLLEAAALQTAEAALTGESLPVSKATGDGVFAGTHITAGRATAEVTATGGSTEIGKIASMTAGAHEPPTPLEKRVSQFGRVIAWLSVVVFGLVIGLGLLRGIPFPDIFMIAISQMVAMVPEGLPVAMTVALAVGVQRMSRRGAIVRRLSAVETLGSTTVICSDKTGTLTRNEMTVAVVRLASGPEMAIPDGRFEPDGAMRRLLEAVVLCNDANLVEGRVIGDPTEGALLTLAVKGGLSPDAIREAHPRLGESPFDPVKKLMSTQHGDRVVLKGAPEVVLDTCDLDEGARRELREAADSMAERALRVLAVAEGTTLLGLLGELDPPRPDVAEAVEKCRAAGIRPVMVTGDHLATGHAVARMIGIAREGDIVVEGRELERMSDEELASKLDRIAVFARVLPAQKLRIVEAYQARGEVVAMTGDGVNDAPALARADVGVAMGVTGTEVAKEAAKIVITDDSFATIVTAAEEGRLVTRNIKKLVLYLFSTSMAVILVLFAALILGYPPPLAAVQILWINLVAEGSVTVNLIMERAEGDEMRGRPTPPGEPLLSSALLKRMLLMTPSIALVTFGWYVYRMGQAVPFEQVRSETFTVLAVCQWFNVLNCRSETRSSLNLSLLANPWLLGGLVVSNLLHVAVIFLPPLQAVFHTVPIPWGQVVGIGVAASLVLWVEEVRKWLSPKCQVV